MYMLDVQYEESMKWKKIYFDVLFPTPKYTPKITTKHISRTKFPFRAEKDELKILR